MEEYTQEEVLNSLLSLDSTRKRAIVDQRSYLIGILAFKFNLSEHRITKLTGINRNTVNYNKRLVLQWLNDKLYKENVYVYSQLYPFDFTLNSDPKTQRLNRVELDIDANLFKKLKKIGDVLNQNDIRLTIKHLLEKTVKLWEE
jgi:hypothetical protein